MEQTFYETFSRETAARLRAHEQWMEAHEETLREMRAEHTEQMQEMRAEHAVWLQTHEGHTQSFKAIMDRLAAGMIGHEARLSEHQRTMQEMITTLQAIRDSL